MVTNSMSTFSKIQSISLFVVPSITGCISSFASISLILSILRSNLKLSTVYRRLIFVLSTFDIILSVAHLLSSLPMPVGATWGAIGNSVTCDLQGFFAAAGFCGTVLYSLSITVYFLLVVKFDIPEAKIKKYVEPFLHAVPVVYSLTVSTSTYALNSYNSAGTFCWIAPEPLNCENDPEVECLNGGNTAMFRSIAGSIPLSIAFFGNCSMLGVIWWTYRTQSRKNQAYARSLALMNPTQDEEEQEQSVLTPCCPFCPIQKCPTIINRPNSQRTSVLVSHLSRPSRASVRRLKEISNRAAAYVIAFTLSFIFSLIYRIFDRYLSGPVPFTIIFLARLFFPLQGFFNILIYTYPHVISYRRIHTRCNWFQALWNVIKTGGDNDQSRVGRASRRRGSIRKKQRVLEQSEYKRRSEVENIMSSTQLNER